MLNTYNSNLDKSQYAYLVQKANEAMANAQQTKSGVTVGAALITNEGVLYQGANLEPQFHQLTICAERSAIASGVSDGGLALNNQKKSIKVIAVTSNINNIIYPCGNCLQVIAQFATADTKIICADKNKENFQVFTMDEIFPQYSNKNLKPIVLNNVENEKWKELVMQANKVLENSFTYTNEKTASLLLTLNDKTYTSVGADSVAFGSSHCAEEGAVLQGLTQGEVNKEKPIKAIIITTDKNEIPKISGNSLQLISEFANIETKIICANKNNKFEVFKIGQLLPVFEKLQKDLGVVIKPKETQQEKKTIDSQFMIRRDFNNKSKGLYRTI